jgi:hypothetical protein
MGEDTRSPAELAADIDAARERLAGFVGSGADIAALVAGLSAADLAAGDGRVRRFAQIAIRHADDHRSEIEAALAARPTGRS